MTRAYHVDFEISGTAAVECVEIRNPAMSGVVVVFPLTQCVSESGFGKWTIKRYVGEATHGTGADEPTQAVLQKYDSTFAAATVQVFYGLPPQLDFSALTADFKHDAQMDPSDAGDDAEIYLQKYLTDAAQLVINPGECVGITIPDGAADYDIELTLLERT